MDCRQRVSEHQRLVFSCASRDKVVDDVQGRRVSVLPSILELLGLEQDRVCHLTDVLTSELRRLHVFNLLGESIEPLNRNSSNDLDQAHPQDCKRVSFFRLKTQVSNQLIIERVIKK